MAPGAEDSMARLRREHLMIARELMARDKSVRHAGTPRLPVLAQSCVEPEPQALRVRGILLVSRRSPSLR